MLKIDDLENDKTYVDLRIVALAAENDMLNELLFKKCHLLTKNNGELTCGCGNPVNLPEDYDGIYVEVVPVSGGN